MDTIHRMLKKIYYHDTDCGNVVYYSNYLKYFEEARTEYLKNKGIDIGELHKNDIIFVVRNVNIDYKAPASYGQTIEIFSSITEIRKLTLNFLHEAKKDDQLLISASTQLVCVNSNFRPKAIPEDLVRLIEEEK